MMQAAKVQYAQLAASLWRDALASGAKAIALGAATAALGGMTLGNLVSPNRNSLLSAMSGAGAVACGAMAYGAKREWEADWDACQMVRHSDHRGHFLAAALRMTQTAMLQDLANPPGLEPMQLPTASPAPAQTPTPQTSTAPPHLAHVDLARDLALQLKSAIIVGQPGSGKGLAVAHAIRHLKVHRPEVSIWIVDPKADPNEQAYWNPADRLCSAPLPEFPTQVDIERFQGQVTEFITAFKSAPAPKLLVFDEALAVKESMEKWFKGIMAGFNHLCSTGRSRGVYGWLISQTPNATDFGISGGARNVYRRVLLLSADDLGLIVNRSTFFSGVPFQEQLEVTGRVFYDSLGSRWAVLPHYPLISDSASVRDGQGAQDLSRHDQLEKLYQAPPAIAPHEQFYEGDIDGKSKRDLSPEESAILDYCRRKEGATVRQIQQAKLIQLQGLGSSTIKALCEGLAVDGLGRWDDGDFLAN